MAAGDQLGSERVGSHWLYAEPSEDDVRAWFETQALHPGMDHDPYLGGIVVIPQTEKVKVTRRNANDQMFTVEEERAAFTPYVKVDTRVRYFWDYVRVLNDGKPSGEYVGVIQPVAVPRITDSSRAFFNAHLPEGFSIHATRQGNDSIRHFIVATFECAIYERQSYADALNGKPAFPILRGRGTKQVSTNYKGQQAWADDAALMKAETGAIGRALGVAGILVVGTGVASAEDIQEAVATGQGQAGGTPDKPVALPPVVNREGAPVEEGAPAADTAAEAPQEAAQGAQRPEHADLDDAGLRKRAEELRAELEKLSPEAWAAYVHWYTEERQFAPLDKLSGSALKGAVVKLERTLDEVKGGAS